MDEQKTQNNNPNSIKSLRTYMTDMADTVRANEISVIKVALAEQNKNEREDLYRKVEGTTSKKVFWFLGGIILIAGAIYGSYFLIQKMNQNNIPQQIVKEDSIISYDEVYSLEVKDGDNLVEKIKEVQTQSTLEEKSNWIKMFSFSKDVSGVKEKLGVKSLFSFLEFNAPSSLVRSLSDSYMVGTYTMKELDPEGVVKYNPKLFIILQTKDYNYTYAGMLAWEKNMASDTMDLFSLQTIDNKLEINERAWKDIIINNKDARVLVGENSKNLLYYVFLDKSNLLITDNIETIKESLSRLAIKNIKPL